VLERAAIIISEFNSSLFLPHPESLSAAQNKPKPRVNNGLTLNFSFDKKLKRRSSLLKNCPKIEE
jgi:hypothetical protein